MAECALHSIKKLLTLHEGFLKAREIARLPVARHLDLIPSMGEPLAALRH